GPSAAHRAGEAGGPSGAREAGRAGEGAAIAYRMTLTTAEAQWVGFARIGQSDGAVQIETPGEPPPRWLADFVRQLLRTSWNARRGDDASPWPERITRWRDERLPTSS
ncbi:MAG TPA: hypothetical protein VFS00_35000, partial [Polyangiaceae bacterium]|nr:hypothetical protein [Polyangiaceae bacterium]